jgi:hypothetical protein
MGDAGWSGRLVDVSAGGVGLVLRHRFRPGSPLVIGVEITEEEMLSLAVTVRHATAVRLDNAHAWLLGCELEKPLSREQLAQLVGRVETNGTDGPPLADG